MKRCSNLSGNTDLESKTMKYHFTLIRQANSLNLQTKCYTLQGEWQSLVNLKTPVFYNVALLRPTETNHSVQVYVQLRTGLGSVYQTARLSNQGVRPEW